MLTIENILIVGTGRLPLECLRFALKAGLPIRCIEPESQIFSPLAAGCRTLGVQHTHMIHKSELTSHLEKMDAPTLLISAYNSYIFPEKVLDNPNLFAINFHNSLLPKHRGRNATSWAIFEQDTLTGVTWHRIRPVIDAGEILLQGEIPIDTKMTALDLTLKSLQLGARTLEILLPDLLLGKVALKPCDISSFGAAKRMRDIPNGGLLDLNWGAGKISAFVRALDYGRLKVFPDAHVEILGRRRRLGSYSINFNEDLSNEAISYNGSKIEVCSGGVSVKIDIF